MILYYIYIYIYMIIRNKYTDFPDSLSLPLSPSLSVYPHPSLLMIEAKLFESGTGSHYN